MIAIVLGGVLIDRAVLTFRTIAIAAMAVLLLAPEAVAGPSFQMSFAATLALIAGYQGGAPFKFTKADSPLAARIALWGVDWVASLMFASLLAGFATMPYAAFHFHRMSPYGVLANLLAMPVVSAVVMPAALVAIVVMPFGLDDMLWRLMGYGIEWMDAVAVWVAGLPGAVGRVTAFGTGPLLVCTLGLIVVCLLRTPLRWLGGVMVAAAAVAAFTTPQPDVLIAANGDLMAVRTAGGHLSVIKRGGDTFAVKEWLAADADPRTTADPTLDDGVSCDQIGCVVRLADGSVVALSQTMEAFDEDCRKAALVVSSRRAPQGCAATHIDHAARANSGAVALRRVGAGWVVTAAKPEGTDRPWAPSRTAAKVTAIQAAPAVAPGEPTPRATPTKRDATPNESDIEPGE